MKLPTKPTKSQKNGNVSDMQMLALLVPTADIQAFKLKALQKGTTMSKILRGWIKDYTK